MEEKPQLLQQLSSGCYCPAAPTAQRRPFIHKVSINEPTQMMLLPELHSLDLDKDDKFSGGWGVVRVIKSVKVSPSDDGHAKQADKPT